MQQIKIRKFRLYLKKNVPRQRGSNSPFIEISIKNQRENNSRYYSVYFKRLLYFGFSYQNVFLKANTNHAEPRLFNSEKTITVEKNILKFLEMHENPGSAIFHLKPNAGAGYFDGFFVSVIANLIIRYDGKIVEVMSKILKRKGG